MAEKKQFEKGKMVPVPSVSIIPERDLDKTPILECSHLGIDFGGLTAVNEFNIVVGRTEIAGLIGPNGAGKTTVFNLLTKVYQPTRGTILLDGLDTHGKTPAQINRMGIARTFQNIRLFNNLSVEDNVKIGLHNQEKYSMVSGILRLPKYWRQEKAAHERALELLSIFNMETPTARWLSILCSPSIRLNVTALLNASRPSWTTNGPSVRLPAACVPVTATRWSITGL